MKAFKKHIVPTFIFGLGHICLFHLIVFARFGFFFFVSYYYIKNNNVFDGFRAFCGIIKNATYFERFKIAFAISAFKMIKQQ